MKRSEFQTKFLLSFKLRSYIDTQFILSINIFLTAVDFLTGKLDLCSRSASSSFAQYSQKQEMRVELLFQSYVSPLSLI